MAMRHVRMVVVIGLAACLVACGSPEERAAEFLARAQASFDKGDLVEAEIEAKNAAQVAPKNAAARYLLALIAERNEKPGPMIANLQLAVSADPNLVEARVKLGLLYYFGRAYEQAAEQATAALALAPEHAGVRTLHAAMLLQQGKTDAALAEADKALALDPAHVQAISLKASVLADKQPDAALGVLDEAIGRLPATEVSMLRRMKLAILQRQQRTPEVERELLALTRDLPGERIYPMDLARMYTAEGRVDEAEKVMRGMVAASGGDTQAKVELAVFLTQARTPAAAEETLLEFVKAQPENQPLRLALAQFYELNNRRADAVTGYDKVIALDARSPQGLIARNRLVVMRLQDRDLAGARKLVDGILADAPDDPPALLVQATLLFVDKRYADAVSAIRGVLRREPGNEEALLLLARTHLQMDDLVLAKDAYRKLLDANPRNTIGAREFIELAQRTNSLGEAQTVLRGITGRDPGNAQAGALLADVLLLKGDVAGAETEARRIAATADRQGIGAFELGRVLATRKRYNEAAQAYLQALSVNPDNPAILTGLAASLYAADQKTQAIAVLREQVQKNPGGPNARLLLGNMLAGEGPAASRETQALFESVIKDQPGLPAGYLATAALYPEDPQARIKAYQRGLAAIPANPDIGLQLAAEYQLAGQGEEAIRLYEELLVANPGYPEIMNDLAAALLDYRDQDPASIRRALELADQLTSTDNPLVMDTVGWAYLHAGKNDQAVRYLERAAAAPDAVPAIYYHLGMAYVAAGNPAGARQALEKALAPADVAFVGVAEARRTLLDLKKGVARAQP